MRGNCQKSPRKLVHYSFYFRLRLLLHRENFHNRLQFSTFDVSFIQTFSCTLDFPVVSFSTLPIPYFLSMTGQFLKLGIDFYSGDFWADWCKTRTTDIFFESNKCLVQNCSTQFFFRFGTCKNASQFIML